MARSVEEFKEYMRVIAGETAYSPPGVLIEFFNNHMSREGALVYALEHCQLTDNFPRWFGSIVANCPHIDARSYMIGNMFVEEVKDPTIDLGHNESMWLFTCALGATEDQIRTHIPFTTTTMAMHYWDNISRTKSWLESFASIGVLELVSNAPLAAKYGQLPPNARKPFESLGLSERELAHWAAAEAADHGLGEDGGSHGEDALDMLAKYAKTTEQQDACGHSLRESIQVLRAMYDAVGRAGIEATRRARMAKT